MLLSRINIQVPAQNKNLTKRMTILNHSILSHLTWAKFDVTRIGDCYQGQNKVRIWEPDFEASCGAIGWQLLHISIIPTLSTNSVALAVLSDTHILIWFYPAIDLHWLYWFWKHLVHKILSETSGHIFLDHLQFDFHQLNGTAWRKLHYNHS